MAPLIGKFWLALAALLLSGCGGLFYQPNSYRYTYPDKRGVTWQDHRISRPGGGTLRAAWIEGSGSDTSKGLLIQFHGNAQNMTAHWLGLHWAIQRGWKVLAWDYSGYGASDGSPSRQQVARDADAFLDWVSDSILPHHHGPVVLVGQSLGSAILLRAFPSWKDRARVTLVVSEGGFPRYRGITKNVVSRHWPTWPLYPLVPLLIDESESPAPWIPKVAPTPFLILSCDQDQVVPPRFQTEIHGMAPGSWLWQVQGCRHLGAMRSDSIRNRFQALVDSLDLSQPR